VNPRVRSDLGARRFRANPSLEFAPSSELRARYGERLAAIEDVDTCVGIVRPRDPRAQGTLRAVDRPTALLLARLQTPGLIPFPEITGAPNQAALNAIARLVLDGLLEIQTDRGWVGGPTAHGEILELDSVPPRYVHPLGQISRAALRYAEALELDDVHTLAWRLYSFNRRPVTPSCFRARGSPQQLETWLGVEDFLNSASALAASWERDAVAGEWLYWWPSASRRTLAVGEVTFKLYVSPKTEQLPACLRRALGILAAHYTVGFKVGGHAHAVQRPDKFVAYFSSLGGLRACATALQGALQGLQCHGVPFSAPLTQDGLLSWGVDPPSDAQLLAGEDGDSWRSWVTSRLASYLIAAQRAREAVIRPVEFALARLSLDGIDTEAWAPDETWLLNLMRRRRANGSDH
jgi:hypothetical protein